MYGPPIATVGAYLGRGDLNPLFLTVGLCDSQGPSLAQAHPVFRLWIIPPPE